MKVEEFMIKSLRQGLTLPEIAVKLQAKGVTSSSLSTLEKLSKSLRHRFHAKTSFHLAVKLCEAGMIDVSNLKNKTALLDFIKSLGFSDWEALVKTIKELKMHKTPSGRFYPDQIHNWFILNFGIDMRQMELILDALRSMGYLFNYRYNQQEPLFYEFVLRE